MKGFGRIQPRVLGIAIAAFVAGASIFASPVPQAIAAVIATDVECTGCVGANDIASSAVTTTKLASNSVNGGKISDGTISAADLGVDSVGASELKGVTKMIFASCSFTTSDNVSGFGGFGCAAPGARPGDHVIATANANPGCHGNPKVNFASVVQNDLATLIANFDSTCSGTEDTHISFSAIVFQQ